MEQLIGALDEALTDYAKSKPSRESLLDLNNAYATGRYAGRVDTEKLGALETHIQAAMSEHGVIGNAFVFDANSYAMTPRNLAWWLLERARHTSSHVATSDLERFAQAQDFGYHGVYVLSGVQVNQTLELANNISLVLFSHTPESDLKFSVQLSASVTSRFQPLALPTAALIEKGRRVKRAVAYGTPMFDEKGISKEVYGRLEDARLCVGIAGPCSPLVHTGWVIPDPDVPFYSVERQSSLAAIPERLVYPTAEPAWDVKRIHEQFLGLPEEDKEWLRIPMRFVAETNASSTLVGYAIYLGIAIESLFLHNIETTSELSFRASLHAARFLGRSPDERREIFDLFKLAYTLRSKAVHTGSSKQGKKAKLEGWTQENWKLHEAEYYAIKMKECLSAVASAIRKVLVDGKPDWKTLELE